MNGLREIDNGKIVFDTREREFVPNVGLYEVVWGCAHTNACSVWQVSQAIIE